MISYFSADEVCLFFQLYDLTCIGYYYYWSPALAEGTYKFMPVGAFVRSLVRSFVSDALFSELARYFFLIFCMKLGDHICSKVTKPEFWAKKGSKKGFFEY